MTRLGTNRFLPLWAGVLAFLLHLLVGVFPPSFLHLSGFIFSLCFLPSFSASFHRFSSVSSLPSSWPPPYCLLSILLYFFALDYPLLFPSSTSLSPLCASRCPSFSFSLSFLCPFRLSSSLPLFLSLFLTGFSSLVHFFFFFPSGH